jgi:hypothetical protein
MKTLFRLGAMLALVALGMAGGRAARHVNTPSTLQVDYYYIPHCMSCARVLKGLDGVPERFGPRVHMRTVDCFSAEGKAAAATYGFVTHGLVIRDSRRGLIFQEKDHGVNPDDVIAVLRQEVAR